MKKYTYHPLDPSNIPAITPLLFNRQLKECESFSFLQNDKLHIPFIQSSLEKIFKDQKIVGTGAFDNDELVGYIFAQVKFDETRGKHAW
ncbi:MAG TPA: GNAT family N-acetyltransferase, partial [Pseudoneobacillus sp.]|nr:GNAT family N-acetyltransferase [Pseudoneobacillus sp.]